MPRVPFRDRTPSQLREQAQAHRRAAAMASGSEAANLLRLAERYETIADMKDGGTVYHGGTVASH